MREYIIPQDQLMRGLRLMKYEGVGRGMLVEATGLYPMAGGLRWLQVPTTDVTSDYVFPYPQLFRSYEGLMVMTADGLYQPDGAGSLTPLLTDAAMHNKLWTMANLPDRPIFVATDGTTITRNPTTSVLEVNNARFPADYFTAIEDLGGQLIGILKDDPNHVAWSDIGDINFDITDNDKGEAGFAPMLWSGNLLVVRQLGKHFIAYGDNGITAMMPFATDIVTGFGHKEMKGSGIRGRWAVTGDDNLHYFVDSQGTLWRLTYNHELSFIGYQEFIEPLGADVVLSYSPRAERVYISGATSHYIYAHPYKALTGPHDGSFVCVAESRGLYAGTTGRFSNPQAVLVTEEFDMDFAGIKNLTWVELYGTIPADVEVAADYRFDRNGGWTRTDWRPTTSESVGPLHHAAGVAFRLCVRSSTPNLALNKAVVRWQPTDKRFVRGISSASMQSSNAA